ncbi:MAG TPA: tetratricopeptide repeat protein [Thermoanaerobaculia bacterium]|nr:tetratricopeptide repeat protein [Thermoanaerobaculia bacterium]
MNRDNLLFATIGILVGFITGYLVHEVMATRQPPRLTPEMRAQIVVPGGAAAAAPEGDAGAAPAANDGGAAQAGGAAGAGTGGAPAMQAIQELKAYVDKNPNDANAVRQLADLNFEIRNWKRAQELYRHYLELKPGDPDVMTDLGISYRETAEFDKSLQLFQAVHKAAPDHWKSYFNEVVVLAFDLKKPAEAKAPLEKLQQMQPSNPDVVRLADAVAKQRSAA